MMLHRAPADTQLPREGRFVHRPTFQDETFQPLPHRSAANRGLFPHGRESVPFSYLSTVAEDEKGVGYRRRSSSIALVAGVPGNERTKATTDPRSSDSKMHSGGPSATGSTMPFSARSTWIQTRYRMVPNPSDPRRHAAGPGPAHHNGHDSSTPRLQALVRKYAVTISERRDDSSVKRIMGRRLWPGKGAAVKKLEDTQPPQKGDKHLRVKLPIEMVLRLQEIRILEGRSVAEVVKAALQDYFERELQEKKR